MGHQIIKQPNGNYVLWSTIVDDFIMLDATPADIVKLKVEEFKERTELEVKRKVEQLERGEKAYYQFTITWEEALAWCPWRFRASSVRARNR